MNCARPAYVGRQSESPNESAPNNVQDEANAGNVRRNHEQDSGLAERFGSGDGEEWTSLTRQIAFEPLPASVLFAPYSRMCANRGHQ